MAKITKSKLIPEVCLGSLDKILRGTLGCLLCAFVLKPASSATLSIYQTESDFLAAAPIASTEDFDDFPTGTGFADPTVVIDGVHYGLEPGVSSCTDSDGLPTDCWRVRYGGSTSRIVNGELQEIPNIWPASSEPNNFVSTNIFDNILSFGDGAYVQAIGFFFSTPVSPIPGEPPYPDGFTGWEILVTDVESVVHIVDVLPPIIGADPTERQYFGFQSSTGISNLVIRDKSDDTLGVNWAFDDVSRSLVAVPLPGAFWLIGSGLALLGFARRRNDKAE